jgi:hypothetical protein
MIRAGLRSDRRARASRVAEIAAGFLAAGQVHRAFETIAGWYKSRTHSPSKPLWVDLEKQSQEYAALYAPRPVVGRRLLVRVEPYDISDKVPIEAEIIEALHHLRRGRAAGPSRMKVESLLEWEVKSPEAWSLLVQLVQHSFTGHDIPLAYSTAILVLIPKSEFFKFRGITLLEVLYKLWAMIVYRRAMKVIHFHPGIHGFCRRRGCSTAILECKLEMQLAAFQSVPYYQVFLDLAKAFDSIDRDRLLDILAGYGFGPNVLRFLRRNWANARVVLRQMGYFGPPIYSDRGIWQGDILSPLFLNIIVDCVLRQWYSRISPEQVGVFYADDGRIAGYDREVLQQSLNFLLQLFAQVGLLPNVVKTKAMVSYGCRHPDTLSTIAYKRRYDVTIPTYRARKLAKVQCPHCQKAMTNQYLPQHIRHVHNALPAVDTADSCTPPAVKRNRIWGPASPASNHYQTSLNGQMVCPVPDCPTWTTSSFVFLRHLCIRHPTDSFTFREHPDMHQCTSCGIYMINSIPPAHLQSRFCIRQSARRERLLSRSQAVAQAAESIPFSIGGKPVEFVDTFRYLGRMVSKDDSDDMAAFARLEATQKIWGRFSHLLHADGASAKVMGRFYRTILQQTLLFGSATWVLSRLGLSRLERFHARCARGILHRHIQRRPDGTWFYPPTAEVLEACGLKPISFYIHRRRAHLLQRYAREDSSLYSRCASMASPVHGGAWWQLPASE